MPYCQKCGGEVGESDGFCPNCGAPVGARGATYVKPRERGWSIGRIVIVIIGLIVVLTSFGLLAGGTGIMVATRSFSDEDGFLLTREAELHVSSHAIVAKGVNIDIDVDPASSIWLSRLGEFVTFKIVTTSSDPSKDVFIGIAREEDAGTYLQDAWYHEVDELHWSFDPWEKMQPNISFNVHQGDAPAGPPVMHSFWVAHSSNSGVQELEWKPEIGRFWVVLMNADGSAGVNVDIQIGAKVPLIRTVGNALLAGGFVALFLGALMVYYGVRKRS